VEQYCRAGEGHRWQYGASPLHGGYLKATNTHTVYVTLIAFPLQRWLHERASLLRHSTLPVLFDFSVVAGYIFETFSDYLIHMVSFSYPIHLFGSI